MRSTRCELTDLKMKIQGTLPDDLQGHVFIIAPVGSVNSFFENKMFTVNYGRSFSNLLVSLRWIYELEEIPQEIEEILATLIGFFQFGLMKDVSRIMGQFSQHIFQHLIDLIENLIGKELQDFTYLIRWDGVGGLERWKLVHRDRTPVKIEQTIHQIGVTKDYVVLMDTAFIAGLE